MVIWLNAFRKGFAETERPCLLDQLNLQMELVLWIEDYGRKFQGPKKGMFVDSGAHQNYIDSSGVIKAYITSKENTKSYSLKYPNPITLLDSNFSSPFIGSSAQISASNSLASLSQASQQ